MTDAHVVSALKEKRIQVTPQIESSQGQLRQAVMVAGRLDTNDKGLCRVMMRGATANLKHWSKKRDLIRAMPGVGQQLLWEVAG